MKVLVLGGSGYVGARLAAMLRDGGTATPLSASFRQKASGPDSLRLDTRDPDALTRALEPVDAVVNCVAGSASAIAEGARVLTAAARSAGCRRLVHLSSMAVYGMAEGRLAEDAAVDGSIGWYARAKCDAEAHVGAFAAQGGIATVMRPGCIWGAGSDLWVGRIASFLQARRLGDLGIAGDGWSNLVHVDDVCRAICAALRCEAAGLRTFNLAAPDSPRWNDYFIDLALAIGATPVQRLAPWRLRLDTMLFGPPLKMAETLGRKLARNPRLLPAPMPPNLPGLWERHLQLDSSRAERELGLQWTPYALGLQQAAGWWLAQRSGRSRDEGVDLPRHDPAA